MAKSKSKSSKSASKSSSGKKPHKKQSLSDIKSRSDSPFYKYQNYFFIGIIILVVVFFFREGFFGGKIFASADNLSPYSFKTFLEEAKRDGIFPLWTPFIFGGMPSLASLTTGLPAVHNIFSFIWDSIFKAFAGENFFLLTAPYYFVFGITLYFYIRYKFKNNFIALYCALSGVLATGLLQLIITGHHTKMMTIAFFPLVLLLIDQLIDSGFKDKKKLLIYLPVLTIIVYIQLHFHHIQILFYSYLVIGLYFGYILIYRLIKKGDYLNIVKAIGVFIVATILAVAMDANIIMSIKEYNNYSIRGQAGIQQVATGAPADEAPLDYNYATNWSFSPGEVLTFIIPYYYGFGNVEYQGQRVNAYWGQMPFTDSPVYFGVITLLLGIIGIWLNFRRNISVQALTFIAVFLLFLSFGRTFPPVYDFFYNYFPFFSSFRAPVMAHYFMDIAFVILAGFGLKSIFDAAKDVQLRERFRKLSFVLMGLAGLMFLISLVGFEGSYKDSVTDGPKAVELQQRGASPQQVNQYLGQVAEIAYDNVIDDMRLHAFLILIVLVLAYMYTQSKISGQIFTAAVILVAVFDLWNIGAKTLHWDNPADKENLFAKSDYVDFILKSDPETFRYRIAEYNGGQMATSNFLAYYKLHQFNGYHGAKIRNYQDAIDVAGDTNPLLLSLADVKYLITDQPFGDTANFTPLFQGSKMVYGNKNALPRAFFVDKYQVASGQGILNNIRDMNFNPREVAFLEEDPGVQVEKPGEGAYAKITEFNIHNIAYDVNATGNNMLVFGEIYYPAGWKAYIDGQETKVYKTDYLFRSIIVPAGNHKVEFIFDPDAYSTGKTISITANILVVLLLLAGIGSSYISRNNKPGSKKEESKHEETKTDEEIHQKKDTKK